MTSIYRNPDDWVSTGPMTPGTSTTTGPGPGQLGATTTTYTPGTNPGYWKGGQAPTSPGPFMPKGYDDGGYGEWMNDPRNIAKYPGAFLPTMSWGGEAGGFTMDDMYRLPSAQTGMPTTRATAQAATPWTPKKGIFQENVQMTGGDYAGTPTTDADRGMWKADPNVDYGQAPEQGMVPVFDREGNHYGWEQPHSYSTKGGSGLFGSFGDTNSWNGYYYDAQGNLQRGGGSVTPSKSAGTNFMSYAVPVAMAAGLGYGAAGGAFTGGAAVPGGAGAELGAGSGLVELGGGGAGYTGSVAATGGATSLSALPGAGGSILGGGGSITELLTKYGPKVLGALTQMGGGQGGQGGQGGGGPGILDLLGGYYSGQQMKDYSGNMKEIYSNLLNRQDQFRNQLLKSYEDPNQFYGSNQWKGLESVYQNSIDRNAAKGGTLANPTDRERLLQSYAMKELENYRGGLRQAAGMTNPENALDALAKGYQAEAYANLGPWATASRGGTGSVGNIVNTITSGAKTAGEIWDFLKDFFDDEDEG